MMSKRRSVIQLTPLLDLLIILVFALLLGLRQQGRTEEDRTRSVVPELARSRQQQARIGDLVAELFRLERAIGASWSSN
jgi:hypothetical protein